MSLIRIFEISPPLKDYVFCGVPQEFVNADWFRDDAIFSWLGGQTMLREVWEAELRRKSTRSAAGH